MLRIRPFTTYDYGSRTIPRRFPDYQLRAGGPKQHPLVGVSRCQDWGNLSILPSFVVQKVFGYLHPCGKCGVWMTSDQAYWNGFQRQPVNYWMCGACVDLIQGWRDQVILQNPYMEEEEYEQYNYWSDTYYVHSNAMEEDEGVMASDRYKEVF